MRVPRVFVSHASEDKVPHVRALAEALLYERVPLWIDRPGVGAGNLGLDEETIHRHDVRRIDPGQDWDRQILEAHASAGAVLACLSKSLTRERQVLVQELALARANRKLVTCIIDDLAFDALPRDLGLADVSRAQSPRIDTALLGDAVALLQDQPGLLPENLPEPLRVQWELVRGLVAALRRVLVDQGMVLVSEEELAAVRTSLRGIPHWPTVRGYEIPPTLVAMLAQRLDQPGPARTHFDLAMKLALESRDAQDTPEQVAVSAGETISPEYNPLASFWLQTLALAGLKSRRTLAAIFLTPGTFSRAGLPTALAQELDRFLGWLSDPSVDAHLQP